jgi:hypothetical protein
MSKPSHSALGLSVFFSLALLSGCSFVDTVPGSERVVISYDTDNCKKIGDSKVKVLSEIAGIDRSEETIEEELNTLARNAAFEQGANTIKPASDIVDGSRSYSLYRCRN